MIRTADGSYLINCTTEHVEVNKLENQTDNHIEVINGSLDVAEIEQALNGFILSN